MLADELDTYKERGNKCMDNNIQEIQGLYKEEGIKREEERIEDKEVILIKPYKISKSTFSSSQASFITDEVKNLLKYMKFVRVSTQTRILQLSPYYQSLKSRGEQDSEFWKEVAIAFVDQKYNTETARNNYPIIMFQGGLPYKPYFIVINNRE